MKIFNFIRKIIGAPFLILGFLSLFIAYMLTAKSMSQTFYEWLTCASGLNDK